MSRIGKLPIDLPQGVEVKIEPGNLVTVKGPKGSLTFKFHPKMEIKVEDNKIIVNRPNDEKFFKALHGTTRAILANMVHGVTKGWQVTLEIKGIGYRAKKKGNVLELNVGYSHSVEYKIPEGIDIELEGDTVIHVKGIDKQKVGQVAAEIRAIRPPDPYKGKGIKYKDEVLKLKPGKAAAGKK